MRQLTGSIPPSLNTLTQLQTLNLGTNEFIGSVPDLSALTNLKELYCVQFNDQTIASYIDRNSLTGPILTSFGALTSLQILAINNNQLTSLPSSMANLKSLNFLSMGVNNFGGDLPSWIMGMTGLTFFSCWGSGYSGTFPDVGKLVNMVEINLGNSGFTGSLPSSIGNLKNLKKWSSDRNNLQGEIPSTIASCTQLQIFNSQYNQHSGPMADSLSTLPNLQQVDLTGNFFTQIPSSAFSNSVQTLTYLALGENAITGSIPLSLTKLYNLQSLNLNDNLFSGPLLDEVAAMISLTNLTLNNNSLSGVIPASLGNLRKLTNLRLDSNQFTGDVSDSLGNLTLLQSFNVSSNCLTGTLPTSLLAKFNGIGIQRTNCIAQTPTNTPSSSASSIPVAAIAGGITGVIVLIGVVVGLLLHFRNRKSESGLVVIGNDGSKKDIEVGKVSSLEVNDIADALVKNSNEVNTRNVPLATSPQQNTAIADTKAGFSLFPRTTTTTNQAPNPFTDETKPVGLFEARSPPPRPIITKRRFQMDDKQAHVINSKVAVIGMLSGMGEVEDGCEGDGDVEATLQGQWGPYFKWSCEQVSLWAIEKRFDESFLDLLRQNEVDGSILHSLDRETIKTELGVVDLRIRAKVLQSIELLRESLRSGSSANVGTGMLSPVAPARGVSRTVILGSVEGVAPPAYNMGTRPPRLSTTWSPKSATFYCHTHADEDEDYGRESGDLIHQQSRSKVTEKAETYIWGNTADSSSIRSNAKDHGGVATCFILKNMGQ
ncbi:hypothetical protein HDU76_009737 [Blyttiomyces sp. JEL0837]|nr:hypothetical protein HDU76_009737 [Blyttiomyces sp. JEL0837]